MSSSLNQPQTQTLQGPFPEWYSPSPADTIERIETTEVTTQEVIQTIPTLAPQVKLGLETERVIPQWENVSVGDLNTNTKIDNLWGRGRQQTLNISPLEEGAKAHGDKFRSDWENAESVRNARDWREVCEPNRESAKFHGDKLFDSTANVRPTTQVRSEPVILQDNASLQREDNQFINKSLTDLRSNSEILDRNTWSPNLRTFDAKNGSEDINWTENAAFELENKNKNEIKAEINNTGNGTVDWSSVDLLFPTSIQEIHRLEENERQDRIRRGVDPVLLGKHHKFQHELLHHHTRFLHHISSTSSGSVESSLTSVLPSVPSLNVIKETTLTWSSYLKHNAKSFYAVARDSLGMNTSSLSYITKEEEKERTRKMSEKIDPMMDARKRRVEEELLTSIKIAS